MRRKAARVAVKTRAAAAAHSRRERRERAPMSRVGINDMDKAKPIWKEKLQLKNICFVVNKILMYITRNPAK